MLIPLEHGEPIRFGADGEQGVVLDAQGGARIVDVADVGEDALLVHDEAAHDPSAGLHAVAPGRGPHEPTPIGVFRAVDRPEYAAEVERQVDEEIASKGAGDLASLLRSGATWEVG